MTVKEAMDKWDKMTLEEKEEFLKEVLRAMSWIDLADLEEPEPAYSLEKIEEFKNLRVPVRIAEIYEERKKRARGWTEEEIISFLRWWFFVIVTPAPYLYRMFLIRALKRRGIWLADAERIVPQAQLSERENLFPLNWSLRGAPDPEFTERDLILFKEMESTLKQPRLHIEPLPEYSDFGAVDLEEHLISNGEDTGDYRFRSIAECPNFFNKIPGIDVEDELDKLGIPYWSPNPSELKRAEDVYWRAIRKEIEEYKEKIPGLKEDLYETYAECQARIAYDEAYGQLYHFFKERLSWAFDQMVEMVEKVLGKSKDEAERWVKEQVEKAVFDLVKKFEIK